MPELRLGDRHRLLGMAIGDQKISHRYIQMSKLRLQPVIDGLEGVVLTQKVAAQTNRRHVTHGVRQGVVLGTRPLVRLDPFAVKVATKRQEVPVFLHQVEAQPIHQIK